MLYANNPQSFPKLTKALENYGVDNAVIDAALEYLDISKERNNALLDKIPVQTYIDSWRNRESLETAVKREILPKDHELLERYVLLSQALYREESGEFMYYIYGGQYNTLKEHEKDVVKILSSRFGDKAEACFCAVMAAFAVHHGSWTADYKSPRICEEAVEFAENPLIKAMLCALALNQTALPEKQNIIEKLISKPRTDSVTEKVLAHIMDIRRKAVSGMEVLLATAEGAYFSDKMKEYFISELRKGYDTQLAEMAVNRLPNPNRTLNLIVEVPQCVDATYIRWLAEKKGITMLKECFGVLAVKCTDEYIKAMNSLSDISKAEQMEEILKEANPKYIAKENHLKEKAQARISKDLGNCFGDYKEEIRKYLSGSLEFADIKDCAVKNQGTPNQFSGYILAYGMDDFMKRVLTVMTFLNSWNVYYCIRNVAGFEIKDNVEQYVDILVEMTADGAVVLERLGFIIDNVWQNDKMMLETPKAMTKHIEMFTDVDVAKMTVTTRWLYVTALATANRNKYKSQIMAMAGDTSKKIKEALTAAVSIHWHDDIVGLLTAKKSGLRELAVSVIEKNNDGTYKTELEKAFEKEKSEKLKTRIAGLIGVTVETETTEQAAGVDIVSSLAKGNKAKKVAWLFEQPYKTLNFRDGGTVPEDYLKTLIILYSDMPSIAVNSTAVDIAAKIDPYDLNDFTVEVFRRWAAKGAAAKTKWVMWFCGVHGGHGMIETLMKYIKDWTEHSRGAIASEAVYAMAVNGSSEALMNVDSMARKFKHKQVRNAANDALDKAAELLGITKEELADRIVPDMGFDDKMCRVFDYGKRQFNVYLTPTLEIEIYNGDKKVKNMPKVGVNDDKEIAEKSYNDFKVMKKQIKTVVENQKQRLEYVLMCDRKWTCENWKKLFVKNPVMHCFAIGLIWGIYDNSGLIESFRYMDDGSFTNINEDEFELPENASIGLVHPIELSDEQKASWAEQLSDYEIIQPFNQLGRLCFKPTEQELNKDEITRFDGVEVGNYTLRGKLTKQGWNTGIPQDAGWFWEFVRSDVTRCIKNSDGSTLYEGYHTEIEFSGMGIDYMDAENVTLGKLTFGTCGSNKHLKIKNVNSRYFSEIIMQLTLLGNAANNTEV
ncbi:MAG: DUF4132 domain-containing protein [Ruminococcus sp.]|nr:DUF4132 domain-containing protein [Ruminococcus sp.]